MSDVYDQLLGLQSAGVRYGLERIEAILAWLGHPERAAKTRVLVAGTNGKGSVAATLSAIATRAGRRTGLFTSPHLTRVSERFRIDDADLSAADFDRVGGQVLDAIEASGVGLSFFEAMVTLAVLAFREAGCEVVILEAGLGGRRDGTRPVSPTHAVVTGVARDHMKTLGPTLADVAREKLDICELTARCTVALPPRLQYLAPAHAWRYGRDVTWRRSAAGMTVTLPGARLRLPAPVLLGGHQRRNAAIAASVAHQMGFSEGEISAGMLAVRWPGRMQRLLDNPPVWLDGAHNPDAVARLLRTLSEVGLGDGFTLVFGAHPRKNTRALLQRLAAHAGTVVCTTAAQLTPVDELLGHLVGRPDVVGEPDCGAAVERAQALGHPVLIAGSLYLAGAVLGWLEDRSTDGWRV